MNDAIQTNTRHRVALYLLTGLVVFLIGFGVYLALSQPPQMGTDEEVFSTVDALYTAVRNHDEKRIGECEQRLNRYREAGKLPPNAADSLAAIISRARSGSWDSAAERLYEFMLAQRREGTIESRPPDRNRKGK
jgi:hypothetical protein